MRKRNPDTMSRIVAFADEFRLAHRRSPSTTEIADAVGVSRSTAYHYLVEMNEKGLIRYDGEKIETPCAGKERSDMTRAPILGSISCGAPLLEEENIESYVSLPTAVFGRGRFFLVRANGDSMTGAGIDDGDLIVVRQQEEAQEGEVVVALIDDGTTTLKRFYKDRERRMVRLHPENPALEDIYVENCRIQGVAVKVLKDIAAVQAEDDAGDAAVQAEDAASGTAGEDRTGSEEFSGRQ